MQKEWMKELSKDVNNREFSQLTHEYYKLATMRVMQFLRDKYNIPEEDVLAVTLAVFARMLNEACYSVGANIKNDYTITDFYSKEHLLTLVHVLSGNPLKRQDRTDIDADIQSGLQRFKQFVIDNGSDFFIVKD